MYKIVDWAGLRLFNKKLQDAENCAKKSNDAQLEIQDLYVSTERFNYITVNKLEALQQRSNEQKRQSKILFEQADSIKIEGSERKKVTLIILGCEVSTVWLCCIISQMHNNQKMELYEKEELSKDYVSELINELDILVDRYRTQYVKEPTNIEVKTDEVTDRKEPDCFVIETESTSVKKNNSSFFLFSKAKIAHNVCALHLFYNKKTSLFFMLIEYLEQSAHKIQQIKLVNDRSMPAGNSENITIEIKTHVNNSYLTLLDLFENHALSSYLVTKFQINELIKDIENDMHKTNLVPYDLQRQNSKNNNHNFNSWIVSKLEKIGISVLYSDSCNNLFKYQCPSFVLGNIEKTKNLIETILASNNSSLLEQICIKNMNLLNVDMLIVASWINYIHGFGSLKSITIDNCQIDCRAVCHFIKIISDNSLVGMEDLSLSFCKIDKKMVHNYIIPLCSNGFDKLKRLKLNANKITYWDISDIAPHLSKISKLELLDLSGNFIKCGEELLEKLTKKFLECRALKTVLVGQNFFEKSCKSNFKKEQSSRQTPLYYYKMYQIKAADTLSILSEKESITCNQWLVALVCKKNFEHAMIYMEGMRTWGQRFLERYHINARNIVGVAEVDNQDDHVALNLNPKNYYINLHIINKEKGKALRESVNKEKGTKIDYSKYASSTRSKGKHNCLTWCLDKLKEVDIHIQEHILGLPSRTAQNKRI